VCGLRYQPCNVYAPYFHRWPVRSYNIFPHYLINSTGGRGGGAVAAFVEHKMCVLIFSTTLV
jgi:hypothetical protein